MSQKCARFMLLAVLFAGLSVLILSKPAVASTNTIPDSDDFVGGVKLLVGNPSSAGQGIDANYSYVKVYSLNKTISVSINNFGECYSSSSSASFYDWYGSAGSPGSTLYEIFATDATETSVGSALPGGSASNGGTCSADRALTVTHSGVKSARVGHTDYYVFVFKATMVGSGFGWNAFSLSVPAGNHIGYSDKSGDQFAIKSQFNDNTGPTYSTFNFHFSPSCETTAATTKSLKWFDADQGESNQLRTLQFDLVDETTNTLVISNRTNLGGQNVRMSQSVTFQPGHKYLWRWENVSSYNGLQLELPFDSIYYSIPCQAGSAQPSSVVDKPTVTYPDSAIFTHYVNVSGYTFGTTVNYSVQRYRNGVAEGSVQTGTYTTTGNGAFLQRTNTFTTAPGDAGDRICERMSLTGASNITISNSPSESCTGVVARPYLKIGNGDLWAGAAFDHSEDSCASQSARLSNVSSWQGGAGATVEYGLFALGTVTDFGSANAVNSTLLTFANTPSFGSFGALTRCIPNYFSSIGTIGATSLSAAPSTIDLASLPGGTGKQKYVVNGDAVVSGTLAVDRQVILLVDGDVTIPANVAYGTTFLGQASVPALWIVAKGNIYIEEDVTAVSGLLVAQGTSALPGKLATCVRQGMSTTYTPLTTKVCNGALEIYGSIIADQILWQRTRGTAATGQPHAESVQFDVGLYLNNPAAADSLLPGSTQNSSELPPIY